MARASGDQQAITALTKIGPPPWHSLFNSWPVFRKWRLAYQAKKVSDNRASLKWASKFLTEEQ
jgi:hypothetical protein